MLAPYTVTRSPDDPDFKVTVCARSESDACSIAAMCYGSEFMRDSFARLWQLTDDKSAWYNPSTCEIIHEINYLK